MGSRNVTIVNHWRVAWSILTLFLALLGLTLVLGHYTAADVRSVCEGHNGVAQVADNTWSAGAGNATVVCRDGWVGTV